MGSSPQIYLFRLGLEGFVSVRNISSLPYLLERAPSSNEGLPLGHRLVNVQPSLMGSPVFLGKSAILPFLIKISFVLVLVSKG